MSAHRFSDEEYRTLSGYFSKYETDNGEMSAAELYNLVAAVSGLGEAQARNKTEWLMRQLDTNGGGSVTFTEFMKGYQDLLLKASDNERAELDVLKILQQRRSRALSKVQSRDNTEKQRRRRSSRLESAAPALSRSYCRQCNGELTDHYLTALSHKWHEGCLRCQSCQRPVGDGQFYEKDQLPMCQHCYDNQFSCRACGAPIKDEYYDDGAGGMLHPHCQSNRAPPPTFLSTCVRCGGGIDGNKTIARGQEYHQDCFRCTGCNAVLVQQDNMQYFLQGNAPYCARCAGGQSTQAPNNTSASCHVCGGFIENGSKMIRYDNRVFHPACFTCEACAMPLPPSEFFIKDGQKLCGHCSR